MIEVFNGYTATDFQSNLTNVRITQFLLQDSLQENHPMKTYVEKTLFKTYLH